MESALDAAAIAHPSPGRVIVHRLNRTEYTNAVRDLLALDIDGRSLLPADEPDQQGFDNMAGVLSVSPRLLENYLAAASTVSRLAIGRESTGPIEHIVKISTALVQDERTSDDLPFGSRGGASISYYFDKLGVHLTRSVTAPAASTSARWQEFELEVGIEAPGNDTPRHRGTEVS